MALHVGTLASILVFYRRRILDLLRSDRRVIPLLVVGTIPAAVIGVSIKKFAPWILNDLMVTGVMFVITGIALMYLQKPREGKRDYVELGIKAALFIGMFQAFALLPGISRSGFTIVAGVMVGLRRNSAATFSFLLAIPAILGAGNAGSNRCHRTSTRRTAGNAVRFDGDSFPGGSAIVGLAHQDGRRRKIALVCLVGDATGVASHNLGAVPAT